MKPYDGRVIANFTAQALTGRPLTGYGDSGKIRSFATLTTWSPGSSRCPTPPSPDQSTSAVPEECTVAELARLVRRMTDVDVAIDRLPLPQDDPPWRRPVIERATRVLG